MAEPYNVDSSGKSSRDPEDQNENNKHKDSDLQESNSDTLCNLEPPTPKTGDNFYGDKVSKSSAYTEVQNLTPEDRLRLQETDPDSSRKVSKSSTHTEEGTTKDDIRQSFHSDEQKPTQGTWRLKEDDLGNNRKVPEWSGVSICRTRQWVNYGSSFGNLQDNKWNTNSESVSYHQTIAPNKPPGKSPYRRGANITRQQYSYGIGSKSGQLQDSKWDINSEFVGYRSQHGTYNPSRNRSYRGGVYNSDDGRLRYDKMKMCEIYFELFTKDKLTLSGVPGLTLSEPLKLLVKDRNMWSGFAKKVHGVEYVDRKIMDAAQFEQKDLDIIPLLKAKSRIPPGFSGYEVNDVWDATDKENFDPGKQKWNAYDAFTALINQSRGSQTHSKESNVMPRVLEHALAPASITHHNVLPDSCPQDDITETENVENQVVENALKDDLDKKTNSELKQISDAEDSHNQDAEKAPKDELNKKTNSELKQTSESTGKQSEPPLLCKGESDIGNQAESTYSAADNIDVGGTDVSTSAQYFVSPSGSAWGFWFPITPLNFRQILKERENERKLNSEKGH